MWVYSTPTSGNIYFIENMHLRKFGFPRLDGFEKKIKWKKMNFTTDLPKNNPQVKYLVASGRLKNTCYRMHVVALASKYDRRHTLSQVSEIMKEPDDKR